MPESEQKEEKIIENKSASDQSEGQKTIEIPPIIQVKEFALKLGKPVVEVIGELVKNGVMATINEDIDFETAAIISEEFGFIAEEVSQNEEDV